MYTVGIVTISDRSSCRLREDLSGPAVKESLANYPVTVTKYTLVPDEANQIINTLLEMVDKEKIDLIFTTGGTGFSPRDVTPEATKAVLDKEVPGIPEAMRWASLQITKNAMLSRAVAGIRKNSLIINLPGSPKAVQESLAIILPAVFHGLKVLKSEINDCQTEYHKK